MPTAAASRTAYDHRIRRAICDTGDPTLFSHLGIPRSTVATWIRRGANDVVTDEVLDRDGDALAREVVALRAKVARLGVVVGLVVFLLRLSGFRLERHRLEAAEKGSLLRVVERARGHLPLASVLRVLRISSARYHAWVRGQSDCQLDDEPSCPRTQPTRLRVEEILEMKAMVLDPALCFFSVRALALHAQRIGRVFAHPRTGGRLIRERGWVRPRVRKYPAKPKVGIRATRPGRGVAHRHDDRAPARRHAALPPRGHRQLLAADPRLETRRVDVAGDDAPRVAHRGRASVGPRGA